MTSDAVTTLGSGVEETIKVNRLGETIESTDRNNNVHAYSRDVVGRLFSDAVTTLGSGVDVAVRRIEWAFDGQGNAYLITSYDAASGGSIVNQVRHDFNGLGQLTSEWQRHDGAVVTLGPTSTHYDPLQITRW